MRKQSSNRSGLLLIEIIIAILFFSVVSAICLQLFVKSHNLSKDSESLVSAVNQVTSVMEQLQYAKPDDLILYYDEHFSTCDTIEHASYELQIVPESIDQTTTSYTVTMRNNKTGDTIYEQPLIVYTPATM